MLKHLHNLPKNTKKERYHYFNNENSDKFLLLIGLNPSHATNCKDSDNDIKDKTVLVLENYITNNYDSHGFVIINLTPQRTPKQIELNNSNNYLLKELSVNLSCVNTILTQLNIVKIIPFWGNGIAKHSYLIENAIEIKKLIDKKKPDLNWYCVKRNKSLIKHPRHFGRMKELSLDEKIEKNDLEEYFSKLHSLLKNKKAGC